LKPIGRFKNGKLIRTSDRIKTTATADGICSLKITETTTDDAALYACEVSNAAGSNRSEATGTVSG